MTSWRLLASPAADRRLTALACAVHALAVGLPWVAHVPPAAASAIGLAALALLPSTLRCLPRRGRLLALELDPAACALRNRDGWWPARIDPATRVHRDLVVFAARTADGPVVALLGRRCLGPQEFRRLKVLLRARDGAGGRLC